MRGGNDGCSNHLKHSNYYVCIPSAVILTVCGFCPQDVQYLYVPYDSINQLVFTMEIHCVSCEVGTAFLNITHNNFEP